MKTLIVYGTKYGCTVKCAEMIKTYLCGDVTLINGHHEVDLTAFDNVIIGGSVYMGKMRKEIIRFCRENKSKLIQKRLVLFACCYTVKDTEGFLESIFPEELLKHAIYTTTVGGELNYQKMNIAYRKMFQWLKKIDGFNDGFGEPNIQIEEIKKIADLMNH